MKIKKIPCVFIDYRNEAQIKWWNNIGSWLVRARQIDTVVETATNKPVGAIIAFTSPVSKFVMGKMKGFIENPVKVVNYRKV